MTTFCHNLFSILTWWLRNFEKNYSHFTAIIWDNPILLVAEMFYYELKWTLLFKKSRLVKNVADLFD